MGGRSEIAQSYCQSKGDQMSSEGSATKLNAKLLSSAEMQQGF